MLKFIDENDFLLVDKYKQNDDGSVSWVYDEGEGKPTHSGALFEGFTRTDGDEAIDVWAKLKELEKAKKINVEPFIEDTYGNALANRQAAYKSESDALYLEAVYDGTDESMQKWRDKVAEIKARYPL